MPSEHLPLTARVSFLASQSHSRLSTTRLLSRQTCDLGASSPETAPQCSPRGAWLSGPQDSLFRTLLQDIRGASAPISTFKVHTLSIFHICHTVSTSFQIDTEVA